MVAESLVASKCKSFKTDMDRMEGMSRRVLSYALWVLLRNAIITPLHLYA